MKSKNLSKWAAHVLMIALAALAYCCGGMWAGCIVMDLMAGDDDE